jgi:hypothetical protein
MKTEVEIIETSTSPMTVNVSGYVIQLQTCDTDPNVHGGLNVIAGDVMIPVPDALNGHNVFVIQNNSGRLREGEKGWLILALNFKEAVSYATAA